MAGQFVTTPRSFFSSVFSFQSRRIVCEHAYQMTRQDILARFDQLSTQLAPFGGEDSSGYSRGRAAYAEYQSVWEMLPLYVAREKADGPGYLNRLGATG